MVNRSTGKAPFEVVYRKTPRLAIDLTNLPKLPGASIVAKHLAERVKSTHEEVHQHLKKSYAKYKEAVNKGRRSKIFQEGDFVMVYLRKRRLPTGTSGKLRNKNTILTRSLIKLMIMHMLLTFQKIWPSPQHLM
jgi:hypothetical protein